MEARLISYRFLRVELVKSDKIPPVEKVCDGHLQLDFAVFRLKRRSVS